MSKIIKTIRNINLNVVTFFQQGDFKQAFATARKAVEMCEKVNLTKHKIYCDSLNNLGELYSHQADYNQAENIHKQVLALRKTILGDTHPDVAQSLNNLATFYFSQGNYNRAETLYEEALNLWKNIDESHPQIPIYLNNIAEVYSQQGRFQEAEKKYHDILMMQKCLLGEEHLDITRTLNNLAGLYESLGRYSEAERLHLDALAMTEKILGDNHPNLAYYLNNIAALYDSQGRYLEAEKNYLKALEILQNFLSEDHPILAITLNNLGQAYAFQGRFLESDQQHNQALAMRRRLFGVEHPDIAQSLANLGDLYREQGKYFQAKEYSLAALAMRQKFLGENHFDVAQSLNSLAAIYASQGEYLKAEDTYLSTLKILKGLLGDSHPDIANNLNNIAELYRKQGRYNDAEQKLLEVYEMRKIFLGNEHPDIVYTLNSIAETYRLQGRYHEAELKYLEALNMGKRLLGDNHPDVINILNSLAVFYEFQGNYIKAESTLQQVLKFTKKIFGNEHPFVASALNNLASVYDSLGGYEEAEKIHLAVLKMRQRLFGEQHPDISVTLNNLAEMYFACGRYSEAEQKHREVIHMRKALLGEEHPDIAQSLNSLAKVLAASNNFDDSLSYRIEASLINDKIIGRAFAFSSENDRLAFLEKIRGNFDFFLSLIYQHLSHSPRALQQAFLFVLKRKALTASVLAIQNEAIYSQRYPHLTDKFQQLCDLSAQLIHLSFSTPKTEELATYPEKLAQLQAQINTLQKQLTLAIPEIQLVEPIPDLDTVASALPNDSILIEFVRFQVFNFHAIPANQEIQWRPARYVAFILPANQPDAIRMIDLGTAEPIDNLIFRFRLQASDNSNNQSVQGLQKKATQLRKLKQVFYNSTPAIQLSQAIIRPIREFTTQSKHLILAPDGNLNLVPFQILPTDETGDRLLMDDCTISYLSVGRDILRSKQKISQPSTPLIIADPDFDLVSGHSDTTFPIAENIKAELLNTLASDKLKRAIGTKYLGESIARKLKNARLYTGQAALETLLITNHCPAIILIATHGIFIPDSTKQPLNNLDVTIQNPMMRSGLAFAGANTWLAGGSIPKQAGKGFALAQEIATLDLRANEITVLSACDTARGDIKIGEGVFGLRRAFAVAGAKTLIMSLWSVPDKATALLMERFFDNLQLGMGRGEALQHAQNYIRNITVNELRKTTLGLEVLAERLKLSKLSPETKIDCREEDKPLQHPFYWGAWICQGDTSVLDAS